MEFRVRAVAMDGDGTLTKDGRMESETVSALKRLRRHVCKVILATGETMKELGEFPHLDLFEGVVGEEGGVLSWPATHRKKELGPPPPAVLLGELAHVEPLRIGDVIICTRQPHEETVRQAIRRCDLNYRMHVNREQVMALPAGVDKGSGLRALLANTGISLHEVIGIGDAQNDRALLASCGFGVAVSNAVPVLKQHADYVTEASHGKGVAEFVERLLRADLKCPSRRTTEVYVAMV